MSCSKHERYWPAWAAGDLTGRHRQSFQAHLKICPSCAKRAQAMQTASDLARQALEQQSESLSQQAWQEMLGRLEPEAQRPAPRWSWALPAGLAAAAALALLIWLPGAHSPASRPAALDGGAAPAPVSSEPKQLALADAADRAEHYEMRLTTSDPKIKIVWVFDRNLQL